MKHRFIVWFYFRGEIGSCRRLHNFHILRKSKVLRVSQEHFSPGDVSTGKTLPFCYFYLLLTMFDKSSDTKKRHSIQPKARWNTDVDRGSITCLMSRRHSTPVIGRCYDNLSFREWRCRRGNKHLHDYGIWIYNDVIAAYGSCCRAVTTSSRLWFDLVWPGNLKLFVCDGSFRLVMDLTVSSLG